MRSFHHPASNLLGYDSYIFPSPAVPSSDIFVSILFSSSSNCSTVNVPAIGSLLNSIITFWFGDTVVGLWLFAMSNVLVYAVSTHWDEKNAIPAIGTLYSRYVSIPCCYSGGRGFWRKRFKDKHSDHHYNNENHSKGLSHDNHPFSIIDVVERESLHLLNRGHAYNDAAFEKSFCEGFFGIIAGKAGKIRGTIR